MRKKITLKIRRLVANRADFCCEYCLIHEDDMFLPFEVDHIIGVKHGGTNEIENLAWACPHCNKHKGSDFATFINGMVILFYNPRTGIWHDHFEINEGQILPKTLEGEATEKILQFNDVDLIILRQLLMQAGRYPLSG